MTTEEIKMILDVLKGVTDGAATVAWVWIAASYGVTLIGWVLSVFGVLAFTVIVARASMRNDEWAQAGRKVAKAHGGDGEPWFYRDSDVKAIEKAIQSATKEKP